MRKRMAMPTQETEQPWLIHPDEAAALLGVSRALLCRLVNSGELPAVLVGAAVRIPLNALRDWERKQTINRVGTSG